MNYNIAIDATSIPERPTGIGNYTKGLIDALSKINGPYKIFVFVRTVHRELFNHKNLTIVNCGNLNTFKRILWEQLSLPFLVKKYKIDLLHSPNYTIPYFARCRKVCTIHDLTSYIYPNRRKRIHGCFFRLMIKLSVANADCIVSVSENTKKDILRIFNDLRTPVECVYQGFGSIYSTKAKTNKLSYKSNVKKPYFLFVSTIEPSKNIERLIDAFCSFSNTTDKKYSLYISGKLGWGYTKVLQKIKTESQNHQIEYIGYVKDDELVNLYRNAHAFIYPSLYEGFGIPPLEAMACGVPVLCSNNSSLPEVVGDAAITFDPYCTKEIESAMKQISSDPKLREELIIRGHSQCKKFSWNNNAEKTISLYQKILNNKIFK